MCLTTSLPLLQQHVWAPVPREAQPGFLLSLQNISPLVLSPRSYSSNQLLFWHSFILHRAGFIPPVNCWHHCNVFSSQRLWILHLFPNCYNGWPGSCDLSGIWSYFTGMQQVSWCIICRWNSSSSEFFLWDVLCLGYILSFEVKDFMCKQVYLLLHMNKFCN